MLAHFNIAYNLRFDSTSNVSFLWRSRFLKCVEYEFFINGSGNKKKSERKSFDMCFWYCVSHSRLTVTWPTIFPPPFSMHIYVLYSFTSEFHPCTCVWRLWQIWNLCEMQKMLFTLFDLDNVQIATEQETVTDKPIVHWSLKFVSFYDLSAYCTFTLEIIFSFCLLFLHFLHFEFIIPIVTFIFCTKYEFKWQRRKIRFGHIRKGKVLT